ncbi:MAG TPA: hypothetical protein VGU61_10845 [Noviherbaspirillum sp.]|uniref:hypothetical protein n=1 Tax=Noviherbaspirillum sp. TaxID=1926288 RepID=UPI002DDD8F5D|nr:hypothetical protein [Noviherbaspirillum sp.]HEV2610753.1 hypothetical protein [Noviherbaspirillum sp.]
MTILHITVKELAVGTLLIGIGACHAAQTSQPLYKPAQHLPDLSGSNGAPRHIHIDKHSAGIGYTERDKKWDAKLDAHHQINPSLNVDYGALLTGKLGAGMALSRRDNQTEVLVNGVYAYKHNVHLHLSSGQLWSSADQSGGAVSQSSLLLAARKVWSRDRLLSDVGLATYSVEAGGGTAAPSRLPDLGIASGGSNMEAGGGRLDGYSLQLGLRPEPGSRIELQRDFGHFTHQVNRVMRSEATTSSNRISYARQLDNCVRLHTGLHNNADSERVDLGVAMRNWHLNVSHSQTDGGNSDTTFHVGYSIPLAGKQQPAGCKRPPEGPTGMEPIVSAAVRRPAQLPQAPLVRPPATENTGPQ